MSSKFDSLLACVISFRRPHAPWSTSMVRERVAENVYVFTSDIYASVNAGAVIGPDWSILIDTLAFPEETREIRDFLEKDLGSHVRYVINTHYHADHSFGTSWFPGAVVIGHARCRELLGYTGPSGPWTSQNGWYRVPRRGDRPARCGRRTGEARLADSGSVPSRSCPSPGTAQTVLACIWWTSMCSSPET